MKSEGLVHLIYVSSATSRFEEQALMELLELARVKNAEIDITGMLLYSENSFFQVLEGEQARVDSLYNKISKDPRHTKVTKIIQEPIGQRAFGQWTMAYTGVTRKQLINLEGLSDFFSAGTCLSDIDSGRSKTLLKAFANGRWRQNLG
ncbi:MAG: BLUF domain-containing protein [Myxococcales bacterium]|nr:BLUF domain-containing protein [Myxococcales bacterium]